MTGVSSTKSFDIRNELVVEREGSRSLPLPRLVVTPSHIAISTASHASISRIQNTRTKTDFKYPSVGTPYLDGTRAAVEEEKGVEGGWEVFKGTIVPSIISFSFLSVRQYFGILSQFRYSQ